MTLIPSYRSRPSALHSARASVGAGFCCAFALVGALYRNPLILSGAIGGILVAGIAAGVGREVGRSLRLAVPFALLVALVNALVYQEGETLLLRGDHFLGRRWDVTLEALVEGLMNGMRIVVLIAALGGLMSAAVDPDDLLKALRRVSYRSALTASLATRLVPVLARDAARMGDAARCRPQPPGRLAVVRAALAGALDRAVDVAAALEVRGYSLAGRPARRRRPVSRHDLRVGAAGLAVAALAIGGVAAGVGQVEAYPTLDVATGPAELGMASALVLLGAAPLVGRTAGWGWPVPEPLVQAERFSYAYPEGDAAVSLHDISFELEPGTFTVLAGVSGSGKSTLLRALCGLVPHFHGGEASGLLRVGGLDVRDHGPGELAAVCGTVFQEPETQVVMGGVRGELELPLEHRGEPPAAVARAVEETALSLGIGHLLERRTDTLSGGELQRVAIAAAMVHGPDLLLLDEPTSQLDPVAGDELVWLLRRLNEDWGTAVVVAEHRLERCLPAADRVIALVEGRIACDAPPGEHLAWATEAMPVLATPAARMFSLAGLPGRPASVKEARAGLGDIRIEAPPVADPPPRRRLLRRDDRPKPALALRGVWFEIADGPSVLRGLDLELRPGERVALMGRNGAGKSTLLRLAKGLVEPTRGRVDRAGAVALLLQNPGDYLIHEHAVDDAGAEGVAAAGLEGREGANPRDLSGGERQRLALEVVLAGDEPAAAALLDEPTRGMDRAHKDALAARITELDAAVVVATHDTEFAASFADRIVLLGQGLVIGDGPPAEVLGGGRHFSTEVARVTGGAALLPEPAAALIDRQRVAG